MFLHGHLLLKPQSLCPGLSFALCASAAANHAASCCVSQLVMTRSALRCGKSRPPVRVPGGRGAWMIPLLGQWALQLVENQLAMLLEYAQRRFERMEHRLSSLQGVANIQRVLEDYALASDVGLHVGNVTVGLGKMAANHRSKDTGIPDCEKSKPRLGRCTSAKRSYGAGRPVCVVEVEARACPLRQLLREVLQLPHEQHAAFGLGCCDCRHRLLFE